MSFTCVHFFFFFFFFLFLLLLSNSAGLNDEYIQLRFDVSAEDAADIATQNGGQPMFFGVTRMDRAAALQTTMTHHNWTAATIIHEESYHSDAGIRCVFFVLG